MPEIVEASIGSIAINPYRRLHAYPYIESKIEALMRSIADVGLWPSVIARPYASAGHSPDHSPVGRDANGGLWKYEQAFGHHRVEAARRSGLKTIPLIVTDLSDEQMLQYMGRENLEDYNAIFLIQLESWEAALKSGLSFSVENENRHAIDIARLLGWTRPAPTDGHPIINNTAAACHSAYALIEGGHMARADFAALTVHSARDIAERAWYRIQQIDAVGRKSQRPRKDIDDAKKHIGSGAKETARQVRDGQVSPKALRGQVDVNSYRHAREANKQSPLFARFAKYAADSIAKFAQTDTLSEKLTEIQKNLDLLTLDDDRQALRRLDYELEALADRAGIWRKRLTPTERKVSHLQISGKE